LDNKNQSQRFTKTITTIGTADGVGTATGVSTRMKELALQLILQLTLQLQPRVDEETLIPQTFNFGILIQGLDAPS
jgi:hypothetical protein